jgi:hypothetical protein
MTPRGLIKLTAVANNIEAWRDWNQAAAEAMALGLEVLVQKHQPANDAGWRKIDSCRRSLLAELQRSGGTYVQM